MKKIIIKEEIAWTLSVIIIIGAVLVAFPSREYWSDRIVDQVINPGKPLENNSLTIGEPQIFSVKVPDHTEWELTNLSNNSVILRRDNEKAPLRVEIIAEKETSPPPKTFKEFRDSIMSHEHKYKEEGFSIKKSKNIYINGERWGFLSMNGSNKDCQMSVYIHRSKNYLIKTIIEHPIGKEFNPLEAGQYGRAVAYSVSILDNAVN